MSIIKQQFSNLIERLSNEQLFDIGKNFLEREHITQMLLNLSDEDMDCILNSYNNQNVG